MGNSLADQLVEKQVNGDKPNAEPEFKFFNYELPSKDEFGMPTANSIDYVIARIFFIDYNVTGKERLHLREDGKIWEGDHWLSEDDRNLYRLTQWSYKAFSPDQKHRIWLRLRECLPTLSDKKVVIRDNLIWDMEKGELYYSDDTPLTIN